MANSFSLYIDKLDYRNNILQNITACKVEIPRVESEIKSISLDSFQPLLDWVEYNNKVMIELRIKCF